MQSGLSLRRSVALLLAVRPARPVILCVAVLALLWPTGGIAGSSRRSTDQIALFARVTQPTSAVAAPGDPAGTIYVTELVGEIAIITNGDVNPNDFLDIRPLVKSGGEQGLLSMVFDPGYASNHYFYVDYTDQQGSTRVVRYTANGDAADPSSAKLLLLVKDFAPNHNCGQLQFGPDGKLYWCNGDGGGDGDPHLNGQNLTRPFSKIESLDVRNPSARWQMVAYGLRNPWRFSFDPANGDLYIADVGEAKWEEVDYLKHGFKGPINFGWNHFEGTHIYAQSTSLAKLGHYVPPIYQYPHKQDACSITGGVVYRGKGIPGDDGRYFFGDYCSGAVWTMKVVAGKATDVRREPYSVPGLSSFGVDTAGELYLCSLDQGSVFVLNG